MTSYDFIIAGGGIAGLSLAYHLAQSPLRDRSILIIDKDRKIRNDRTLSFWTHQPTLYDSIAFRSWDRLKVIGEHFEKAAELKAYRYHMVRGIDFYRFVQQRLAVCPNVDFVSGAINQVGERDQQAVVLVDEHELYKGQWVFDSRFTFSEFEPDLARCRAFRQHFMGWEIEAETHVFDPQLPTFMDFRTPQHNNLCFCYLLPFSERHALVEYVQMGQSQIVHELPLKAYIENVLGNDHYRILAKEGGTTPITDWSFPRRVGPHTMAIGTRGGRVKPSSGYAFTRIQRDSAAIVRSLLKSGHPFDVPPDSRLYRLCDSLMLRIMSQHENWLVPLFLKLFQCNPVEDILSFLDESASPLQTLRLTTSLVSELIAQRLSRPPAQLAGEPI